MVACRDPRWVPALVFAALAWAGPGLAQTRFQDCPICPAMVTVPGATVTLGRDSAANPEKGPAYEVTLQPFAISVVEITQQNWLDHMQDWGRRQGLQDDPEFTRTQFVIEDCFTWDLETTPARLQRRDLVLRAWSKSPDHPISCVSHQDALGYIDWLNNITGATYRLPTEAELEYLMRMQPLPDDLSQGCDLFNGALDGFDFPHSGGPCPADGGLIAETGSHRPNALGISDLYGNLWELSHNCWTDRADDPQTHDQRLPACTGAAVAVRGASFDDPAENFRPTIRQPVPTTRRQQNIGFRVVKME